METMAPQVAAVPPDLSDHPDHPDFLAPQEPRSDIRFFAGVVFILLTVIIIFSLRYKWPGGAQTLIMMMFCHAL